MCSEVMCVTQLVDAYGADFIDCPFCGSTKTIKSGCRTTKTGKNQTFRCKDCKHKFTTSHYIEMQQQLENKTLAQQLHSSGKSSRSVSKELKKIGINLSYTTINTLCTESEMFGRFDGGNSYIKQYSIRSKNNKPSNNVYLVDKDEMFERFNQPKRHNKFTLPIYSVITLFDYLIKKDVVPIIKKAKPLPENPRSAKEIFLERGIKHRYKDITKESEYETPITNFTPTWDGSVISDEPIKGGIGSHFLVPEQRFLIGFKDPKEAYKSYKKAFPNSRRTFGAIERFINAYIKTGGIPNKDFKSDFRYYNWVKPWERYDAKVYQPSVYNKEYWGTVGYEGDNYMCSNDLGCIRNE